MDHLKEFSPDKKLFATIQSDGILKIWDAETNQVKQEYIPNLHLSSPCTAIKWILISTDKKAKKKKQTGSLFILLGTNQGGLSLYSIATAKIEAVFQGAGHSGSAVTAIDHDGKSFVYTAGLDAQVIKWNIQQCHQESAFECGKWKEKITALCLIRNGEQIVTASKDIKVWDGESHQLMHTFTGHMSNIIILKPFEYGEENFILSASKDDRNLTLWKIKEEKKSIAFGTFILPNNSPSFVDMELTDDEQLRVVCISRNESLTYYSEALKNIKSKKPIRQKFSLEIASEGDAKSVVHVPISCAVIVDTEILFGYGDLLMKFELINCEQKQPSVVIVRKHPAEFEKSGKKKQQEGVINEALNLMTPLTNKSTEVLSIIGAKKSSQKPVEIPLETRLDNLTFDKSSKRPNAKKLTYHLIQGLQGKNPNVLRNVLKQTDEEVVRATVKYLPTQYVLALVNELSLLMSKKTAGSEIALVWLKHLIQTHSSSLMAYGATNLCNTFGTTLGIIDHRTQNLPKLMRLRGKLDLLVGHLKQNNLLEDEIHSENVLVYEDSDDENSNDSKSNASSHDDYYDFEDEEKEENGNTNGAEKMSDMSDDNSEDEEEEMEIN